MQIRGNSGAEWKLCDAKERRRGGSRQKRRMHVPVGATRSLHRLPNPFIFTWSLFSLFTPPGRPHVNLLPTLCAIMYSFRFADHPLPTDLNWRALLISNFDEGESSWKFRIVTFRNRANLPFPPPFSSPFHFPDALTIREWLYVSWSCQIQIKSNAHLWLAQWRRILFWY